MLGLMQEILAALVTIDVPGRADARACAAPPTRPGPSPNGRAATCTTAVGQRDLRRALDAHREALERVLGQTD